MNNRERIFQYQDFEVRYLIGDTFIGVVANETSEREIELTFAYESKINTRVFRFVEAEIKRELVRRWPSIARKTRDARVEPLRLASTVSEQNERLEALVSTLAGYNYTFTNEVELQDALASAVQRAQLNITHALYACELQREVAISLTERIDLMVDGIGVEVKINGSAADITRQLHRYAQCQSIKALVLVTTKTRHILPDRISGIPVRVVNLAMNGAL